MTLPTETESWGQRSQLTVHDKLHAISTLAHRWSVHLSGAECKLLLWLFGNTIMRGKRSGTYSVSQIVRGVRRADGSGYWCLGTGLSESTVHRSVNSLRGKGVVFTRSGERGISFVINLRWSGGDAGTPSGAGGGDHAGTTEAVAGIRRRANCGRQDGVSGSEYSEFDTPEGRIMPDLKLPKNGISTPKGGVKMTEGGCQNDTLSKGKLQRVNQEEEGVSPVGSNTSAGEKIQGIFSRVKAIHSTRQKELPKNNATGYRQTWTASFVEHHTGIPVGWSVKDAGMIYRALVNWPDRLGSRHDFIGWSVAHWKEVAQTKFRWMKREPAPSTPVPSFFAHHIRAFMDAWCDAETLRWAGTLPGTQARYQQLRHLGMSHDAATLEVAKEQAMAADRQKRAANLRAAKRTLQLAQEVAKRATTRFTADNPHPRARENVRMAPPRLVEGQDGSFVPQPLPKFDFDA